MNDAEDNQAAIRIVDRIIDCIVDRIVDHVIVTTNNNAPGAEMMGDGQHSCPSHAVAFIRKHLEGRQRRGEQWAVAVLSAGTMALRPCASLGSMGGWGGGGTLLPLLSSSPVGKDVGERGGEGGIDSDSRKGDHVDVVDRRGQRLWGKGGRGGEDDNYCGRGGGRSRHCCRHCRWFRSRCLNMPPLLSPTRPGGFVLFMAVLPLLSSS